MVRLIKSLPEVSTPPDFTENLMSKNFSNKREGERKNYPGLADIFKEFMECSEI